jgi:hypothetical protein
MNVRNYFPSKVLKLEKFIHAMTALDFDFKMPLSVPAPLRFA